LAFQRGYFCLFRSNQLHGWSLKHTFFNLFTTTITAATATTVSEWKAVFICLWREWCVMWTNWSISRTRLLHNFKENKPSIVKLIGPENYIYTIETCKWLSNANKVANPNTRLWSKVQTTWKNDEVKSVTLLGGHLSPKSWLFILPQIVPFVILGTLEKKYGKGSILDVFEAKKWKKTTKSPNQAGNSTWRRHVLHVTASCYGKKVDMKVTRDAPECFWDLTRDGVTKAVTYKLQETVKRQITRDGVRSGSR
jgi:hypothetical protein